MGVDMLVEVLIRWDVRSIGLNCVHSEWRVTRVLEQALCMK
jgi:hypothetical protein